MPGDDHALTGERPIDQLGQWFLASTMLCVRMAKYSYLLAILSRLPFVSRICGRTAQP